MEKVLTEELLSQNELREFLMAKDCFGRNIFHSGLENQENFSSFLTKVSQKLIETDLRELFESIDEIGLNLLQFACTRRNLKPKSLKDMLEAFVKMYEPNRMKSFLFEANGPNLSALMLAVKNFSGENFTILKNFIRKNFHLETQKEVFSYKVILTSLLNHDDSVFHQLQTIYEQIFTAEQLKELLKAPDTILLAVELGVSENTVVSFLKSFKKLFEFDADSKNIFLDFINERKEKAEDVAKRRNFVDVLKFLRLFKNENVQLHSSE